MENRIATLLRDGQAIARAGERTRARRKFRAVLILDPANVPALLWLAWLSDDPRASLAYVARALARDPQNPRAHAALRWARRRVTTRVAPAILSPPTPATPASRRRWSRNQVFGKKPGFWIILGLLVVLIGGALTWSLPTDTPVLAALAPIPSPTATASATASPTPTYTPTPTHTSTPTPTSTSTSTLTPTPTPTPSPSHTPTVTPGSVLPTVPPLPPSLTPAPPSIHSNVRWIDVDLTHQRLTAYEGQTMVRTTLISTGLSRTPTPVGRYHIWIKLRYDHMSGPGYYLPNVPYVMYFHRGYGLHGTYWHNNFGHPMSHGCVNLPTPEAEWLFNWAEVGTMVNIHY
jgi:lipoprotein-anchoring transpeptidase ErfK/SrfK